YTRPDGGQLITPLTISELSMAYVDRAARIAAEAVLRRLGVTMEAGTRPGEAVVWNEEVRETFVKYLNGMGRSGKYVKRCVSYLDRYMTQPVKTPKDVLELFDRCPGGKHHLDRAFRNLLKVYRLYYNLPRDVYEDLKEAIPKTRVGKDKYVPPEELIIETFRKLKAEKVKHQAYYNLILDAAIRPEHALKFFETWDESKLRESLYGDYYIYTIGIEEETKQAFIACITPETLELVRKTVESGDLPTKPSVTRLFQRKGLVRPKYVRKFAMNMMRRHGLSRDVTQYLSGQKPRGVDAEHYIELEMLAEEQYARYAEYLAQLRRRI
ncbi:MAG: integrase, partial [Candidatus Freyarchaeota archaeon]